MTLWQTCLCWQSTNCSPSRIAGVTENGSFSWFREMKVPRCTFISNEMQVFLFSACNMILCGTKTSKVRLCCRASFAFLPKVWHISGKLKMLVLILQRWEDPVFLHYSSCVWCTTQTEKRLLAWKQWLWSPCLRSWLLTYRAWIHYVQWRNLERNTKRILQRLENVSFSVLFWLSSEKCWETVWVGRVC